VLFDLDGTLVDTNYLHTLAWSRALRDLDAWAPMHAIHRLIGMGGDNLVVELVGRELPGADDRRAARYAKLSGDIRAFPGARRLVQDVRSRGLVPVLATSSPRPELDRVLPQLGIEEFLGAVTTADDVEASKPAPDVFVAAMAAASLEAGSSVAVGDSVWDVRAATAAGVPCVGVESGGTSRAELEEAGAVAVYRDVGELADGLDHSPIADLRPSGSGR
jgi:HAD superfamily hydrolase (TIGR01509 family)